MEVSALAPPERAKRVAEAMLRHTSTFGVRTSTHERFILDRSHVEVETRFGAIQVKVGAIGDEIIKSAPEYESCAEAARRHDVPLQRVWEHALIALEETRREEEEKEQ